MKIAAILALSCFSFFAFAQNVPQKFGDVSINELKMKEYPADTSATAVILFDKAVSEVAWGSTSVVTYKRHIRIKIFDKSAFDDWATEKLIFQRGGLSKLKAVTYNLENGLIVQSTLHDDAIFKSKDNKYYDEVRFTLPNVKEGSVLEYSYVISSDGVHGFYFQHSIPTALSEYTLEIPKTVSYRKFLKGTLKPTKHEAFNGGEKWVFENVPAFKPEPYMPSEDEYISQIDFSFTKSNWFAISAMLLDDFDFGKTVTGSIFLQKTTDELVAGIKDPKEKIKVITNYVKQSLEWDGTLNIYAEDLKTVFKDRKGTSADINLALASMLKKAGVSVDMVLVSTRGNGFVNSDLPSLSQFNYTICLAYIDSVGVLLDATEKYLPWNVLPTRCLNGRGFIVSSENFGFPYIGTEVKKKTTVRADLVLNDTGELTGKLTYTRDGYAAQEMRKSLNSKGKEVYLKDFLGSSEYRVSNSEFKDIEDVEKVVTEIHEVVVDGHGTVAGDMIYINPFVTSQTEENPFKAEKRDFPLDFVTPTEHLYMCNLVIPPGYVVDELPESKLMMLPEKAGKFFYQVTQQGNKLVIASSIMINQRVFTQDQYPNLRELYSRVVAKQSEQIVLKKK